MTCLFCHGNDVTLDRCERAAVGRVAALTCWWTCNDCGAGFTGDEDGTDAELVSDPDPDAVSNLIFDLRSAS